MKKRLAIWLSIALALGVAAVWVDPTHVLIGMLRNESFYRGRPTSYWSKKIQKHMSIGYNDLLSALERPKSWVDRLRQSIGFDGSDEFAPPLLASPFSGPDPKAIPVLIELLADKDDQVCFYACNALRGFGPEARSAVPTLIMMLEHPNIYYRRNAVLSLAAIGPEAKAAVPQLIEALKEEDEFIRDSAVIALKAIDAEAAAKAGIK